MKARQKAWAVLLVAGALLLEAAPAMAQPTSRQRVIVVTDIGNEPDDTESMVRLLLYSNQLDLEGLIASTSVHQAKATRPELLRKVILGYGKVRANLLRHEPGFPTAPALLALVKKGASVYGMAGVGQGQDSEGSEWILRRLENADSRSLWLSVWGGANTLAQALWKIRATKSEQEANRLIGKLRVYAISDQDDSGPWIRKNFPNLFYIVSPGRYADATWDAIRGRVPGANNEVVSNAWLARHIQQGHGPLGALYPDVSFGMEGDTPAWLLLVPNGLNAPDHPNWGGWGGRYELYQPVFDPKPAFVPMQAETRPIWTNATDTYVPRKPAAWGRAVVKDTGSYTSNKVTLWRWREDFQYDFAARMAWCTTGYKQANHPPVARLTTPERLTVKSGETFDLDGSASYDADGDALSYLWFQYGEAGTYKQAFPIPVENIAALSGLTAPDVDAPQTIHFILKVTDKGSPPLTRYKRVIVTIVPK